MLFFNLMISFIIIILVPDSLFRFLNLRRQKSSLHTIMSATPKRNGVILRKRFLNSSEKISMIHSDYVIFISEIIRSEMLTKYNIRNHKVIPNGVNLPVQV